MKTNFSLIIKLLLSAMTLTACASEGSESGGTPMEQAEIPILRDASAQQLQSIFVSAGDFESANWNQLETALREGHLFVDEANAEWRPPYGVTISSLLNLHLHDISFSINEPDSGEVYISPECYRSACTLRIWASTSVEWNDTTRTEMSWISNPDAWEYTELQIPEGTLEAATGLREYDTETLDVVASLGVVWLSFDGEQLSAEVRTHLVEGYNAAFGYRDPTGARIPDAGTDVETAPSSER